jgi:hypothetical protein
MTLLEVARALVMCTDYALHSFRRRTYAITISPRPLISLPTPRSRDGQVLIFLPQLSPLLHPTIRSAPIAQ